MATLTIDGCTIHYEVFGDGTPLVLTPGGRMKKETLRHLARALAEPPNAIQVLIWDRRNTGASDIYIDSARTEQDVWADDLAELVRRLGIAPAYLGGPSAGCRVSLRTAARHPDVARGLALWLATGGPYAAETLGYSYHVPYIEAAMRGGMEAVAKTRFFAELIAANPANRDRLLAIDADRFIEAMRRWNETFYYRPDQPVLGLSDDDLRSVRVPALLIESDDDVHTREASAAIARLVPDVVAIPPVWTYSEWRDWYYGMMPSDEARALQLRLVAPIAEFLANHDPRPELATTHQAND